MRPLRRVAQWQTMRPDSAQGVVKDRGLEIRRSAIHGQNILFQSFYDTPVHGFPESAFYGTLQERLPDRGGQKGIAGFIAFRGAKGRIHDVPFPD